HRGGQRRRHRGGELVSELLAEWREVLERVRENLRPRPLENLNLKLLALALAFGLWSLVTADVSVPHIVSNVPVRLENVPADLSIAEPFTDTIDVQLQGASVRTRDLAPGALAPRIDLFGAHAGQNVIQLVADDIPAPLGVQVDSIEPSEITIYLEERVRRELPISPVLEGSPAEGYEIVERSVDPETAVVTGPRSRVFGLTGISTDTVNVTGRRRTLARTVAVRSPDPLVEVRGRSTAELTIRIDEISVNTEVTGIPVELENRRYRTAINPDTIGVVLEGPTSVVSDLDADDVRAVIDLAGLEPRPEDYRIEPEIRFASEEVAERVAVLALNPQRLIDVRVYPQPAEEGDE
ncbi:MAG: YbbR-like domain-containing protein, partial [Acidobacteriota bacterium]